MGLWRRIWRQTREEEPLLPRHEVNTSMQTALYRKLQAYQKLRALFQGFMPSNEQTIIILRVLMASDLLNPSNEYRLSDSSLALVHYTKKLLAQTITLLGHKNDRDQIQDFLWHITKSRVSIDGHDLAVRVSNEGTGAGKDASLVKESVTAIGSLLLENTDLRLFISDLSTVGREVFRDTAFSLSTASREVGQKLGPSEDEQECLLEPVSDSPSQSSPCELGEEAAEMHRVLADGAASVMKDAGDSIANKASGRERDILVLRLKRAVTKLRSKPGYCDSVSFLSRLLRQYIKIYSHLAQDAASALGDIDRNKDMSRAFANFSLLVSSFGDPDQWRMLRASFASVIDHGRENPDFDRLVEQFGDAVQEMLTEPAFFDNFEQRFQEIWARSRQIASGSSLSEDVESLMEALSSTLRSAVQDKDIASILQTTRAIGNILSPASEVMNPDLLADLVHVFVPLILRTLKYIPIPRVEISNPKLDLLVENLVLEPGDSFNDSSFLPYKLRVETYNDMELRKARFRTAAKAETMVRLKLDGLSVRAEGLGFWLQARSGLLRLADQGIASFRLDERGIDIHLEVEIGEDRLDKLLSLRSVRVCIHKLDWTVRESKFSFFSWIIKPLLRPILRKTLEAQIASSIMEGLQFVNRELVFARERLRATRIANPRDFTTFLKAVLSRFVPKENPDVSFGISLTEPGQGVFRDIYTPGSIIKIWKDEAMQAPARIREREGEGWRNVIFDILPSAAA